MTKTIPSKMAAAVSESPGQPPALLHVAMPVPGPGEVLIRIEASSVNPTDVNTWRRGRFATGEETPFVSGYDMAGEVVAVGRGVTRFREGDHITGMPRFPHPAGAFAQYAAAPASHMAHLPQSARNIQAWSEAAGLPLAGLTAWQALVDTARLQPEQKVLIHAASGGVGHIAVQLARELGARVTAVTSPSGHSLVAGLGADEVLDRTHLDWQAHAGQYDVVLEPVGGDLTAKSLELARANGVVVALHPYEHDELAARDHRLRRMLVEPDRAALAALLAFHDEGRIKVHVGATFGLDQTAEALASLEQTHAPGKTVIHNQQGESNV